MTQLHLTPEGDTLTAGLQGELDHHAAAGLRQQIDDALASHPYRRLRLDFSRLTFMDSSGIGLIMGRYRLMAAAGGSLSVVGASPRIEGLLRMAGMEKLPIWDETERKNVHETA